MNRRMQKKKDKKITEAINGLISIAEWQERQRQAAIQHSRRSGPAQEGLLSVCHTRYAPFHLFGSSMPRPAGVHAREARATQVIWPSDTFPSLLCRNIHLAKGAK